jgi:hypothetical protein
MKDQEIEHQRRRTRMLMRRMLRTKKKIPVVQQWVQETASSTAWLFQRTIVQTWTMRVTFISKTEKNRDAQQGG